MPLYSYVTEDGQTVDMLMSRHDPHPSTIMLKDGRLATRRFGFRCIPPGCYPRKSDAAGVNPEQAREAYDHSREIGIPTQFDPGDGAAIFEDQTHERRYCEAVGLFQRNAGYHDATPDGRLVDDGTLDAAMAEAEKPVEYFDPTDLSDFVPITGDLDDG